MAEPPASSTDLQAKLMGDWSWRPQMQPKDPGYVYTAHERQAVEFSLAARRVFRLGPNAAKLRALRPWMVPAYDGRDLVMKPVRIGPRI